MHGNPNVLMSAQALCAVISLQLLVPRADRCPYDSLDSCAEDSHQSALFQRKRSIQAVQEDGDTFGGVRSSSSQEPQCGLADTTSTMSDVLSDNCDSCRTGSALGNEVSSCCRKGGQKKWGDSHMFQLLNAVYDNGKLSVSGEPGTDVKVRECYKECGPTWFGPLKVKGAGVGLVANPATAPNKSNSLTIIEGDHPLHATAGFVPDGRKLMLDGPGLPSRAQLMQHSRLNLADGQQPPPACEESNSSRVALVVNRYFQDNLYHNVVDTLFTAFLTASHLALELGCSSDAIEVRVVDGFGWNSNGGSSNFDLLWNHLFAAPAEMLSQMNGCYRKVVYGSMFQQRFFKWPYNMTHVFRSPVMMPWTMAFSQNLRETFPGKQARELLTRQHGRALSDLPHMLMVYHKRWPQYLWDFPWENLTGVSMERQDMTNLSVAEQVHKALATDGIISVMGAGMTHQLFMPPFSALLILSLIGTDGVGCDVMPETWHDTLALHLGHTSLNWNMCRFPVTHDLDILKGHLQRFLDLLLTRRRAAKERQESSLCFLLKPPSVGNKNVVTEGGWQPKCDKEFTMPVQCSGKLARCGKSRVGTPIREDDDWFSDDLFEKTSTALVGVSNLTNSAQEMADLIEPEQARRLFEDQHAGDSVDTSIQAVAYSRTSALRAQLQLQSRANISYLALSFLILAASIMYLFVHQVAAAGWSTLTMVVQVVGLGCFYIVWTGLMVFVNKFLAKDGCFPFPALLVTVHMLFCSIVSHVVIWLMPSSFPAMKQIADMSPESRSKFRQKALLIAIFVAGTYVGDNAALFYSPVGFLQVIKEANVPIIYAVSVALGQDSLSPVRCALVASITIGGWLCVNGEVDFVLVGFLLQFFSMLAKAAQVVTQGAMLKQSENVNLDPITYTANICPTCFMVLTPIAACEVIHASVSVVFVAFRSFPFLILLSCCLAMGTNLVVAVVIKAWDPVCFVCLGAMKNVVILTCSILWLGEIWITAQVIGCTMIFVAVPAYGWRKRFEENVNTSESS